MLNLDRFEVDDCLLPLYSFLLIDNGKQVQIEVYELMCAEVKGQQ